MNKPWNNKQSIVSSRFVPLKESFFLSSISFSETKALSNIYNWKFLRKSLNVKQKKKLQKHNGSTSFMRKTTTDKINIKTRSLAVIKQKEQQQH